VWQEERAKQYIYASEESNKYQAVYLTLLRELFGFLHHKFLLHHTKKHTYNYLLRAGSKQIYKLARSSINQRSSRGIQIRGLLPWPMFRLDHRSNDLRRSEGGCAGKIGRATRNRFRTSAHHVVLSQ